MKEKVEPLVEPPKNPAGGRIDAVWRYFMECANGVSHVIANIPNSLVTVAAEWPLGWPPQSHTRASTEGAKVQGHDGRSILIAAGTRQEAWGTIFEISRPGIQYQRFLASRVDPAGGPFEMNKEKMEKLRLS